MPLVIQRPQNVDIQLFWKKEQFRMSVKDDGVGFEMDGIEAGRGLSTMQRRADALHGKLRVTSQPGEGTTVLFESRIT